MAPRKPTWDWKARNCAEFENFDIPYAAKEYVQNVVGQALKDLRVREWSGWKRENLRLGNHSPKQREIRKQELIKEYPGLLTGPHGAAIKRMKLWLPSFVLSATVPNADIKAAAIRTGTQHTTSTDLKIAIVFWRHVNGGIQALSVFNNHLDSRASFSSFAVDGASTSRGSEWAVGEKGKGFILATQRFFEEVEGADTEPKAGVSFRVGHQIGTLKWKKGRNPDEEDLLQVVMDDLTPRSIQEYLENQATEARYRKLDDAKIKAIQNEASSDEDDEKAPSEVPELVDPKLRKAAQSTLLKVFARRITQQLDRPRDVKFRPGDADPLSNAGRSVVQHDEVSITVVGLDGALAPEYILSGIYGVIPPPHAWRVHVAPWSPIDFFLAVSDSRPSQADNASQSVRKTLKTVKFYHRDQHVKHGPRLSVLSINYHGDLSLTSDRIAVLTDSKMVTYRCTVSASVHQGFQIPELGVQLALDILSDASFGSLASIVEPSNQNSADQYRAAFDAAMRLMHPEIAADALIYPSEGADDRLCRELGIIPIKVSRKAMEIMSSSGAYCDMRSHANQYLLAARHIPNAHGLAHLRKAITLLAPEVLSDNVTIRDYNKSAPKFYWDKAAKVVAFALPPKCDDHPDDRCLCWVGPVLQAAAQTYDSGPLSAEKFFRAYDAMKHDLYQQQEREGAGTDVDGLRNERRKPGSDAGRKLAAVARRWKNAMTSDSDNAEDEDYLPSADDDTDSGMKMVTPPRIRIPPQAHAEPARSRPVAPVVADRVLAQPAQPPAQRIPDNGVLDNDAEKAVQAPYLAEFSKILSHYANEQTSQLQAQLAALQEKLDDTTRRYTTLRSDHTALQKEHGTLQKCILERNGEIQKSLADAAKWRDMATKLQATIDQDEAALREQINQAFESRKRARLAE